MKRPLAYPNGGVKAKKSGPRDHGKKHTPIPPTAAATRSAPMANLRTPLFDWHVAHHGKMVEFGGWDMPVQYTGIIDEHTTVRTAAGLFDISHMGRLSFSGRDALALIQQVYTNNAAT